MLLPQPWQGPCNLLPFQGLAPDNRLVVIPTCIFLALDIDLVLLVDPRLHVQLLKGPGVWLMLRSEYRPY
jgi:hypothetical protein